MEVADRLATRELTRAWQGVLGRLELELNPHTFSTWLKGTRAVSFSNGTLLIEAKTSMAVDFLDRRMRVVVERAAAQAFDGVTAVTFVCTGQSVGAGEEMAPLHDVAAAPPRGARKAPVLLGQINCDYTFDDYLRGRGNALAIEACLSLIRPSDLQADRVVVYGTPGLGKTHLLHALACEARQAGMNVACLTAEDLTNRIMNGYRDKNWQDVRDVIRSAQLLVIDDLQLLPNKDYIQNEVVGTIDAVVNAGGKVAVASERHPFELNLLDRLQSRLGEGLITEIRPFEPAERRAFVECAARRHRVALPAWAIDRIASAGVASARLMLGFVKAAAGLELVRELDPAKLDASLGAVTVQTGIAETGEKDLVERIARHFAVAAKDIEGRARSKAVTEARAVAALVLFERGASLQQVGDVLGKRDKSTIHDLVARGRQIDESGDLRRMLAV